MRRHSGGLERISIVESLPGPGVVDSGLVGWDHALAGPLWKGTARAEDAQGTPTQSRISPGILVYEDKPATVQSTAIWGNLLVRSLIGKGAENRVVRSTVLPKVGRRAPWT